MTNTYGPQIICFATFEIKFSKNGDACFDVEGVDDQVAIYWHRTDSYRMDKPVTVSFPEYFSSSDCDCRGASGTGCACMTDYPYLMDFDHRKIEAVDWRAKLYNRFSDGYWGDNKYRIGNWKKGQSGKKCEKSFWPGGTYRITIWYFNEDKGRGSQKLKISANDKDGGWRIYDKDSQPC